MFVGVCLYRPKSQVFLLLALCGLLVNSIDSCKPQLDRVLNLGRKVRVYGWFLNVVGHNTVYVSVTFELIVDIVLSEKVVKAFGKVGGSS